MSRANACWIPIAGGLTPHGLRHSHKTMMEEIGVPKKLQDDRMGHADGSVQARYSHITAAMRQRLMDDLTAQWETALRARKAMSAGSPVWALDRLLATVKAALRQDLLPNFLPNGREKQSGPVSLGGRPALNSRFSGRGGRI
nr:hypothetical protein [Actinoplanes rishiriensis]